MTYKLGNPISQVQVRFSKGDFLKIVLKVNLSSLKPSGDIWFDVHYIQSLSIITSVSKCIPLQEEIVVGYITYSNYYITN